MKTKRKTASSAAAASAAACPRGGLATPPLHPDASRHIPQVTDFHPAQVLSWAYAYKIDELLTNCKVVLQSVAKAVKFPGSNGPKPYLPTWSDRGHSRGRLGWGEYRYKDPTTKQVSIRRKYWAIPELCRTPLTGSIHTYWKNIGLPGCQAGR